MYLWSSKSHTFYMIFGLIFQEGFNYHHAESGYVMLTYWIPDEVCMLPASPSHQIGVAGFVMNDKREVPSSTATL